MHRQGVKVSLAHWMARIWSDLSSISDTATCLWQIEFTIFEGKCIFAVRQLDSTAGKRPNAMATLLAGKLQLT